MKTALGLIATATLGSGASITLDQVEAADTSAALDKVSDELKAADPDQLDTMVAVANENALRSPSQTEEAKLYFVFTRL